MGFLGKVVKGVTKAVSDTVKTAAKVANKVFSSKVFNIATTAMCFIPGLNAAGLIGKAAGILGKASAVQNWIKSGLTVFNALKNGKGITEAVTNLMSGKFQPLGPISPFKGSSGPFGLAAKGLSEMLQARANVMKLLGPLNGQQMELIKPLLPQLTEIMKGVQKSPFLKNMLDLNCRMQSTAGMLHELQKLLTPHPMISNDYAVRC